MTFPSMAAELKADIGLMKTACDSMRTSVCLTDLLAVMLQIFYYLSATEKGFNLMKLQGFEDIRLGKKFSFRSVLCIFLRNLRPGHLQKAREEQTITVDRSNGEDYGLVWHEESGKILEIHPEGLIHDWNEHAVNTEYAGDGKPVRVDDKIVAVNCIRETLSFANEFEKKQKIGITVA